MPALVLLSYATIWSALVLFVVGEEGKRAARRTGQPVRRAWRASAAGAVLCAIHMGLAMFVHHGWSHRAALLATARQTASVYGVDWSGGLYINYGFLALWVLELWSWRRNTATYFSRPAAVTWLVRCVFFVILVNAVVVFASPYTRWAGVALMVLLLRAWRP